MFVYTYIHTHTHIHIHTHIHTYIHTYIHTCMHACMHACIHTYVRTYVTLRYATLRHVTLRYITLHYITLHYTTLHYITLHTYIYVNTYIRTYIYACVYTDIRTYVHTYVRIYVCIYVCIDCMYIYIYMIGILKCLQYIHMWNGFGRNLQPSNSKEMSLKHVVRAHIIGERSPNKSVMMEDFAWIKYQIWVLGSIVRPSYTSGLVIFSIIPGQLDRKMKWLNCCCSGLVLTPPESTIE